MLETYYVRIAASDIYFIWHSFLSHLLYGVNFYMIYIYVCIYVSLFVCIFYSETGHLERTVWLNGPPCMNMFEI